MEEIWKSIKETEGKYFISNLGRVKTNDAYVKNKHSKRFVKGIIKKNTIKDNKYMIMSFYLSGKRSSDYIHKLVWRYFGDGTESNHKFTIDHIDNDKTNNRIDNLRIIPTRENTSKAMLLKKDRQTKFVGVKKDKNRFFANILIGRDRKYLGSFKTEIEAHNAYQKELIKVLRKAC